MGSSFSGKGQCVVEGMKRHVHVSTDPKGTHPQKLRLSKAETVQVPSAAKVTKAPGFPLRPEGSQHGTEVCYPQRVKGAFKLARWGIIRLSSAQVLSL